VWEVLKEEGLFEVSEERFLDTDTIDAYRWMRRKMRRYIDRSVREDLWPIWGWVQWLDHRRRMPDLRCSWHLPRGTHGVRLCLELPLERVLVSNFDRWHVVLNATVGYGNECFTASMDQDWEDKVLYPPGERLILPKSGQLQACFWSISIDEVVQVKEFVAR
jgi:hypothetical protein